MMRFFKFVLFLVFILVLSSFVFATKNSITLVTVGESSSGDKVGGTADLFLEVKPGQGRVFIDSFPFTREDTQVSIRFAKDVACNFLELDCSRLDFFYSINIGSSSVGGPSAGAAMTILTISVLSGDSLDEDIVVTGTINSGGIIGPVSGLEEKARAAKDKGFTKILVPKRSILFDKTLSVINESDFIDVYSINETNISNNDSNNASNNISNFTVFYADSLVVPGIEIVPVSTLEEVIFEFTGKNYPDYSFDIYVPSQYQDIMEKVAFQLCERSEEILSLISDDVKLDKEDDLKRAIDSISLGINASNSSDFYSSASFCFSANTILRSLEFESYDDDVLEKMAKEISTSIDNLLVELTSKSLKTMSDLETYFIVKERLLEAKSLLEEDDTLSNLGYIMERRYSAVAWSSFFEFKGKEVVLNEVHLSNACLVKIAEAEERLSYIDFLSGIVFDRTELDEARNFYDDKDYAFCIFRASKVKADANAIILSMSLSKDKVGELIDDQLTFSRMQINKQGENFPILGYSYYNYAYSLKDSRPQLSMIFAEYASEFSNLDMYFPSKSKVPWLLIFKSYDGLFLGFLLGIALSIVLSSLYILFYRNFRSKKKIVKSIKTVKKNKNKSKK